MLEMRKMLEGMKLESESELKREVIDTILAREDEEMQSFIEETIEDGCASGVVSELILTVDCENFVKRNLNDILDIYNEIKEYDTDAEVDASYLAWIGFEITIERIANELELR